MGSNDIENFIGHYLREIREDNAAVFIGAGLSRAAGYVDWYGLLEPLAKELGLDVRKEHDLVGLAQFYVNHHNENRHKLTQAVLDAFCDLKAPTDNHKLLARLPIRTYWTTNYDRMIEEGLKASGKKVDSKYTVKQLANTVRGRDVTLFKMHGDIELAAETVLTRDEYEKYHLVTHGPFVNALSGDLVEKTFLFLGFSFTDPNLSYILARIRISFEKHQRQHYCIMKRREREAKESDEDFQQAEIRQRLMIRDLGRFNIQTLLVDRYEDVTAVLATLDRRFRQRTVLVSGSAAQFDPWGRDATEAALSRFARELIKRDIRITTGFGLGVGPAVVTGATQEIYSSSTKTVQDSLMMRPFPISIGDAVERMATFRRYRQELVSESGLAVFFLGNKLADGKIVLADGMREEFNIAVEGGLVPIPVGSSGSMAAELWKEVSGNIAKYFPRETAKIDPIISELGKDGLGADAAVDLVLSIIDILAKD